MSSSTRNAASMRPGATIMFSQLAARQGDDVLSPHDACAVGAPVPSCARSLPQRYTRLFEWLQTPPVLLGPPLPAAEEHVPEPAATVSEPMHAAAPAHAPRVSPARIHVQQDSRAHASLMPAATVLTDHSTAPHAVTRGVPALRIPALASPSSVAAHGSDAARVDSGTDAVCRSARSFSEQPSQHPSYSVTRAEHGRPWRPAGIAIARSPSPTSQRRPSSSSSRGSRTSVSPVNEDAAVQATATYVRSAPAPLAPPSTLSTHDAFAVPLTSAALSAMYPLHTARSHVTQGQRSVFSPLTGRSSVRSLARARARLAACVQCLCTHSVRHVVACASPVP
ncbi:MAG: hypothetical protein EOO41_03285 [Methanobacteriota archaeon]|nr:MAG: hypothetical protein EOO41_03285 [Euryarchaeota archaeon]